MADSAVAVSAGSGTNIDTRTEATNGNHRQVVVLGDPATNAGVAPVDATAGLKVDLGADNDITGTVTANLGATDNAVLDDIAAKLATIDADTSALAAGVSTEYQVDIVSSALPTGAATAAKQDTIIGHVDGIETSLTSIDGKITAVNTGAVVLAAGTAAIGKLAANSGVDIGDVDITSVIPGTGATNLGKAIDTATGSTDTGVLVLATRDDALSTLTPAESDNVQLRTNSTGALWVIPSGTVTVDNSGVTQPVSGTVTANLSATDNAVLDNIDADTSAIQTAVEAIKTAVEGTLTVTGGGGGVEYTEGATDATITGSVAMMEVGSDTVQPIQGTVAGGLLVNLGSNNDVTVTGTVAVTQSGTWDEVGINDSGNSITVDNGGTFATQVDGAALTALQLIDDVVFVDDTATHSTGSTKGVGFMAAATPTDTSVSANDIGMVAMTTDRKLQVAVMDALPAGSAAIGKLAANSGVDIGDVTLTAGTAAIGTLLPPDIDVTAHTNYARKYYTSTGAATDGIIWSPAAGKRWHVISLYINASAAATVTIEDDKAGGDDPVFKSEFAANSGVFLTFPEKYPLASGEDAADLLITTSAGNVYVTVTGYEI